MNELETMLINLCCELDGIKYLVKSSPDKAITRLDKLTKAIVKTLEAK